MHRIERQTVEISTPNRRDGFRVQERLSAALRDGAALEPVFDRVAGDRLYRIERMELDLGTIRGGNWLDHFIDRLREKTEAALLDAMQDGSAAAPRVADPDARAGAMQEPRGEDDRLEALIVFLSTGRLPWWARGETSRAALAKLATGFSQPARHRLATLAAANPAALKRLVIHLPAEAVAALLADGHPELPALRLAAVLRDFEDYLPPDPARDAVWDWQLGFWRPLLTPFVAGNTRLGPRAILGIWLEAIEMVAPGTRVRMLARLAGGDEPAPMASLPPAWRVELAAELSDGRAPSTGMHGSSSAPAATGTDQPREGSGRAPFRTDSAQFGMPPRARESTAWIDRIPDAVEAIAVSGAGVVILHPFIEELFTRLGLLRERVFVDEAARHRAVMLLGYLAFGDPEAFEGDLVLAKRLAAMPLEEVLVALPVRPEEIAAADELLAAVLAHWTALKSASAEWLRSQFFIRDGTLHPVDDGFKLVVESRAQDVLLGRLPWGIGTIGLPWMNELVHVNWNG